MKTNYLLHIFVLALLLFATSCWHDVTVNGNGIASSEGRIVSGFKAVASSGAFEVHITQGDEYDVMVRAEENIIPYIETRVYNGALHIEIRGIHNVRNRLPMEVFVTVPELKGVKLSGSGIITTGHFISSSMDILLSGSGGIQVSSELASVAAKISGSGSIELSGITDVADFIISGSGNIRADNLECEECFSAVSGSGDIWIHANEYLHAAISGSGNVYYYGNPETEGHISGSGKLIPKM
jgi:hypothetical protein